MELYSYLTFSGNCEEALHYYEDCLGGKILYIQYYEDSPMPVKHEFKKKVIHSTLKFGENTIMACDTMDGRPVVTGGNISLILNFNDLTEIDSVYNKLSADGKIIMPLQDTYWGARFGMLTDKYGFNWMFNCTQKKDS